MNKVRTVQLLLMAASLVLTACGLLGGGPASAPGSESPLQPQTTALLNCSQECADRGWCGTTTDEQPVILGNAVSPMEDVRDRMFPQDTLVQINQVSVATTESVMSGEQSQLPFYQVISLDQGKSGWVAGWCIVAAPAQ